MHFVRGFWLPALRAPRPLSYSGALEILVFDNGRLDGLPASLGSTEYPADGPFQKVALLVSHFPRLSST